MTVYHHSEYLFFDGGQPMKFSMRPCDEREKLKPFVEHGGGTITTKSSRDKIRLVPPGSVVNAENCVSSKWIWDCVELNKKIPMADYIVKRVAGSDVSDIEDGDKSGSTQKRKSPKGTRRGYQLCDDLAIINYLYKKDLLDEIKGRAMWQVMERAKVCKGRTWQSLKERFIKQIYENIKSYGLTKQQIHYFTRKDKKKKKLSPTTSEIGPSQTQSRLYTVAEDMQILYYVLDEDEFQSIGGNVFWKILAAKKVVNRSWQSMKEHFSRYVIPKIKQYKIQKDYKRCLKRLLNHMRIAESLSESDEDDDKSVEIEDDSELEAAAEERAVETKHESGSSDFELRMEDSDNSRAENIAPQMTPLTDVKSAILGISESPEIGNARPDGMEISAENTPRTDEEENLIVLEYIPNECGSPKLQISFYTSLESEKSGESPTRPEERPDSDLDEILAKCVKSLEEEENHSEEDEMETDGVGEEQFANTVKNFIHFHLAEKPTDSAVRSEIVVEDDVNRGKRKNSAENEGDPKRLVRGARSPKNPREKMMQKHLVRKAARVIALMNREAEPNEEEAAEIFQIADRLQRIGEQQLDELDLNIQTLSVLFGMSADETWALLELFDFNRTALFEQIGYKFPQIQPT